MLHQLDGDAPAFIEFAVTLLPDGGIGGLGFGLFQGGLGLGQRDLKRAGIDREEEVALFHEVALAEVDLGELAADLWLDGDRGAGLHAADGREEEWHGFPQGGHGDYGHRTGAPRRPRRGVFGGTTGEQRQSGDNPPRKE